MSLKVYKLLEEWRATESNAAALEQELCSILRAGGTAPLALVTDVRRMRSEASKAFRLFVEEAERAAADLRPHR